MRVKSEWHTQKAQPYFSKNASDAGYGLHRANVLSGELAKPRRRPKVVKILHICKEKNKKECFLC